MKVNEGNVIVNESEMIVDESYVIVNESVNVREGSWTFTKNGYNRSK